MHWMRTRAESDCGVNSHIFSRWSRELTWSAPDSEQPKMKAGDEARDLPVKMAGAQTPCINVLMAATTHA
jgi:hypothetical protein